MLSSAARVFHSRLGRRFLAVLVGTVTLILIAVIGASYVMLSSSLEGEDRELIELKSSELNVRYGKDGIPGLRRPEVWVFIRLQNRDGAILFQRAPSGEEGFDLSRLASTSEHPQSESRAWLEIHQKGDEDVLTVLSRKLDDGSLLQVGKSSAEREGELAHFLNVLVAVSAPILLLTMLLGAWLVDGALKPIRSFTRTLEELREGTTGARVPEGRSDDELGTLISLFNGLLDRIEKLILGLRETVNHVAHDLRTPLTRFRINAERALQSTGPSDSTSLREAIEDALESSERMLTLVDQVLEISRAEAGALPIEDHPISLDELVRQGCDLYQDVAEEKKIHLEFLPGNAVLTRGDRAQLLRVIANLLDNALKYTHPEGRVCVETGTSTEKIWLNVSDNGIGIQEEDQLRIWARLFRCDRSRSEPGLGLGLSWVKAIVEAHHGTVEVESSLGIGSTFRVVFPK